MEIWSHKACLASEKMRKNERKWRKIENSIERRNLESSTIRNVSKVKKMSKSTFYLQAKVKWTLGIIQEVFQRLLHQEIWKTCNFEWAPTISHDCAKWKTHQQQFRLLRAFHMIVRNFCMVMRNQFLARLWEFFACSCEIEKHSFSTLFCLFFHFFLLIPLQPPPNQL